MLDVILYPGGQMICMWEEACSRQDWAAGLMYSHTTKPIFVTSKSVAYPEIFFGGGGVQQIQLTEGRENGDLGTVASSQGFRPICKWVKPVFLLGS
jgi:hypothetical protein